MGVGCVSTKVCFLVACALSLDRLAGVISPSLCPLLSPAGPYLYPSDRQQHRDPLLIMALRVPVLYRTVPPFYSPLFSVLPFLIIIIFQLVPTSARRTHGAKRCLIGNLKANVAL